MLRQGCLLLGRMENNSRCCPPSWHQHSGTAVPWRPAVAEFVLGYGFATEPGRNILLNKEPQHPSPYILRCRTSSAVEGAKEGSSCCGREVSAPTGRGGCSYPGFHKQELDWL